MKEIQLTQGKIALVDDEDYLYLSQLKWHAVKVVSKCSSRWYANHSVKDGGGCLSIRMHWLILGKSVDHVNGDGLDNRRSNLRLCSRMGNNRNQRRIPKVTAPYKGVRRRIYRFRTMWEARIKVDGKVIYLGLYSTPEEAGIAYNDAAKVYHGEFASLNVI
jgi:hypothetical protein